MWFCVCKRCDGYFPLVPEAFFRPCASSDSDLVATVRIYGTSTMAHRKLWSCGVRLRFEMHRCVDRATGGTLFKRPPQFFAAIVAFMSVDTTWSDRCGRRGRAGLDNNTVTGVASLSGYMGLKDYRLPRYIRVRSTIINNVPVVLDHLEKNWKDTVPVGLKTWAALWLRIIAIRCVPHVSCTTCGRRTV